MFYMVINHFDQGYSHFNGSSIGYRRFPLAQTNHFLNEGLEHAKSGYNIEGFS